MDPQEYIRIQDDISDLSENPRICIEDTINKLAKRFSAPDKESYLRKIFNYIV
jgi:hypothetical protein